MKRHERVEYHTRKSKRSQENLQRHAERIKALENGEVELEPEEVPLLVEFHRKGYQSSLKDWEDAEKWLSAHEGEQPDKEWVDLKVEKLSDALLGEKLPIPILVSGEEAIKAGQVVTKEKLRNVAWAHHYGLLDIDPSPIRNKIMEILRM